MDDTDTAILIPSLKSSSDYKLPVTKEHNNVGKEEKPMRIRDESGMEILYNLQYRVHS